MSRFQFVLLAAFLTFSLSGLAQSADHDLLFSTRSFKCTFPWKASIGWDSQEPTIESKKQDFGFFIDGVDLKAAKARIIGNNGSDDLTPIPGDNVLTFIEITPNGNVNTTTIFVWRDKRNGFKAVHSRHISIGMKTDAVSGGGPVVTQNYGYCVPWE